MFFAAHDIVPGLLVTVNQERLDVTAWWLSRTSCGRGTALSS